MKKNSDKKKLHLSAETLRELELKGAAGGRPTQPTQGTPLPAISADC